MFDYVLIWIIHEKSNWGVNVRGEFFDLGELEFVMQYYGERGYELVGVSDFIGTEMQNISIFPIPIGPIDWFQPKTETVAQILYLKKPVNSRTTLPLIVKDRLDKVEKKYQDDLDELKKSNAEAEVLNRERMMEEEINEILLQALKNCDYELAKSIIGLVGMSLEAFHKKLSIFYMKYNGWIVTAQKDSNNSIDFGIVNSWRAATASYNEEDAIISYKNKEYSLKELIKNCSMLQK